MSDGRFQQYYWQIRALLGQKSHLLDWSHPLFDICEDYEVEYTGTFRATIVFTDGSLLVVRFTLQDDDGIEEYDYAYQYLDPQGKRLFRYDDAPHHAEVSTYPHHLHRGPEPPAHERDRAYPLDIHRVDFVTVLAKIEQQYIRA
jgi:hypothetical protein